MIHPWDINEVHKGWQLTPDELADVTGHKVDTKAYQLAVLSLQIRLRRELKDDDRTCTVAVRKGCLRVLTDIEASEYNALRSSKAKGDIVRAHQLLTHVDPTGFDAVQSAKHDRRVIVSGVRTAALRGERAAVCRMFDAGSPKQLEDVKE